MDRIITRESRGSAGEGRLRRTVPLENTDLRPNSRPGTRRMNESGSDLAGAHGRLLTGAVMLVASVALLQGCGDIASFIEPLTPAKISGEWKATDVVITNANDPAISFDPIAAGGSLFLRFSIDGDFQSIVQAPGIEDDVEIGTYEIQGEFILVEPDDAPGDTIHFAYQFEETKTVLSLTLATDDLDFDFDGDGSEEPAILFAVVIR